MSTMKLVGIAMGVWMIGASVAAQPDAPIVTMSITSPDGQVHHGEAPESRLVTITLRDGSTWGFRPTILDSRPWTKVTVTIFKMGAAESEAGEVQLTTGGSSMTSKTSPQFKIAITRVEPPSEAPSRTT
jgi:hypothetical protein